MTQILEGIILDITSDSYSGTHDGKIEMYIQPSADSQDPRKHVLEFDYIPELQTTPNKVHVIVTSEIVMQKEQTANENRYRVISGVLQIACGERISAYKIGQYKLPPDLAQKLETTPK